MYVCYSPPSQNFWKASCCVSLLLVAALCAVKKRCMWLCCIACFGHPVEQTGTRPSPILCTFRRRSSPHCKWWSWIESWMLPEVQVNNRHEQLLAIGMKKTHQPPGKEEPARECCAEGFCGQETSSAKKCKALVHCPPFSQALMQAAKVTTVASNWKSLSFSKMFKAVSHRLPRWRHLPKKSGKMMEHDCFEPVWDGRG